MGKVLKKLLIINWHYIDYDILEYNRHINFFTGHSGSGKSTIIDAIQILLLGDTHGEKFFNKAAKDYSDRKLIEYLRGRRLDDTYIRNDNFTSYLAMEFYDEKKCKAFNIGIVFWVDIATSKVEHNFFYLDRELNENDYLQKNGAPISYTDFKKNNKGKIQFFNTNKEYRERFLIQYMGKLNRRFFEIFKKSISFNMDADIKDFIKNFICEDKMIEVEEMQENIRNYKSLEKIIEEVEREIKSLNDIEEKYNYISKLKDKQLLSEYYIDKVNEEAIKELIEELNESIETLQESKKNKENKIKEIKELLEKYDKNKTHLNKLINTSSIKVTLDECNSIIDLQNEKLKRYKDSEDDFNKELLNIDKWKNINYYEELKLNYSIEKVFEKLISEAELMKIVEYQKSIKEELEKRDFEYRRREADINDKINKTTSELNGLEKGIKYYNKQLILIKETLEEKLSEVFGEMVNIDILADIIEIKNQEWRNAIEGYMASSKYNLIIEPKYYEEAMIIYEKLNMKEKYKVALVDVQKIIEIPNIMEERNLATIVNSENVYAKAYVNYLLNNVVMCESVKETRKNKIGITKSCILYKGYILRALNERHYTLHSVIGTSSKIEKIKYLQNYYKNLNEERENIINEWNNNECSVYKQLQVINSDNILGYISNIPRIEKSNEIIIKRQEIIENLDLTSLNKFKEELEEVISEEKKYNHKKDEESKSLFNIEFRINEEKSKLKRKINEYIEYNKKLISYEENWLIKVDANEAYRKYINQYYKNIKITDIVDKINRRIDSINKDINDEKLKLYDLRLRYNEIVNNRFDVHSENNEAFSERKISLEEEALPSFKKQVSEQKEKAMIQFRDDFIYKMQDNIEDIKAQFNELNKSIEDVKFGKEKYRFTIKAANNYEVKKYYDMFTNSDIISIPNSLFSNNFEEKYSETINDLFDKIVYTKDDLTQREKEKIEENIRLYSDYRTYLDFDMECVSEDGNIAKISKALSKNSGGEGQNPLYIVLLSAFVKMYRLDQENKEVNHTLRLVVFDEAFNKMDAEKVKISLDLIRELKLQAIVAAPNDKMQNYIESSEKTFIFNNNNNNEIQIAEFEKEIIMALYNNDEAS